jgi:hypothetical protein
MDATIFVLCVLALVLGAQAWLEQTHQVIR